MKWQGFRRSRHWTFRRPVAIALLAVLVGGTMSLPRAAGSDLTPASRAQPPLTTEVALGEIAPPSPTAGEAGELEFGPVPRASCGPNDLPETALQGQVPILDRLDGRSQKGYRCNLELVGQYVGEGASWQLATIGDCGYYNTANNQGQAHPGTVVVDASNPKAPYRTQSLTSKAFLQPWESLKVNKARGLLAGVGFAAGTFAIYDVKDNCGSPRLISETNFPELKGHAGDFAPDGMTYYATNDPAGIPTVGWTAIDTSNPEAPMEWWRHAPLDKNLTGHAHDLAVSEDGMRLYVAKPHPAIPGAPGQNGLEILDVSDIQRRLPNPRIRLIGSTYWTDGGVAQAPLPVKIGGRQYVVFTDEMGAGGLTGHAATARACAAGEPPFGFARIIDITDETQPRTISHLKLEVHDPANCASVLGDETTYFGYDSHYCSVDDEGEARLLACSYFQAGLRVFDINNPAAPREIAYYNPPARPNERRPGSSSGVNLRDPHDHAGDRTADWTSSKPAFRRGGAEVWFTSTDNGFQIVRLSKTALKASLGVPRNRTG